MIPMVCAGSLRGSRMVELKYEVKGHEVEYRIYVKEGEDVVAYTGFAIDKNFIRKGNPLDVLEEFSGRIVDFITELQETGTLCKQTGK